MITPRIFILKLKYLLPHVKNNLKIYADISLLTILAILSALLFLTRSMWRNTKINLETIFLKITFWWSGKILFLCELNPFLELKTYWKMLWRDQSYETITNSWWSLTKFIITKPCGVKTTQFHISTNMWYGIFQSKSSKPD